jgi:hypothetical protein
MKTQVHVVQFEPAVKVPPKLTAKHNGRVNGSMAMFDTLADHPRFVAELQARVDALCARKGISPFNILA